MLFIILLMFSFTVIAEEQISEEEYLQGIRDASLMYAVKNNDIEAAKVSLNLGANPNPSKDDFTPLYMSVIEKNDAMTQLLLENGAAITKSVLELVAMNGPIDTANLLAKYGATFDSVTSEGETLLAGAVRTGNIEMVEFLLEQGIDPLYHEDSGHTAMSAATYMLEQHQRIYELIDKRISRNKSR